MPGSIGTLVVGHRVLALSSIQRMVDMVFEQMLGSVILQPILPVYLIPESVVHVPRARPTAAKKSVRLRNGISPCSLLL